MIYGRTIAEVENSTESNPSDFSLLAKRNESSLNSTKNLDEQKNSPMTIDSTTSPKMEELGASEVKKKLKILTLNSGVNPNPEVETHNYRLGKLPSFKSVKLENIQNYLFFNRCKLFFSTQRFFFLDKSNSDFLDKIEELVKSEFSTLKSQLHEFPDLFEIYDNFFNTLWSPLDLVSTKNNSEKN